jgi:O-antigen/teichoic acid export membrane protein
MTNKGKVFNSVIYLAVGLLSRKIITLIFFTIITYAYNLKFVGSYFLLISFSGFLSYCLDFGLATYLERESSQDITKIARIFRETVILKCSLFIFILLFTFFGSFIFSYRFAWPILLLMLITSLFDALSTSCYSVLRVSYKMQYEAFGMVFGRILMLLMGIVCATFKLDLFYVMFATFLNSIYIFCYGLIKVKKFVPLNLTFSKLSLLIDFKLKIFPIFASSLFSKLLFIDIFILSLNYSDEIIGIISIPITFIRGIQFIPLAIMTAVFPALSFFYIESKDKMSKLFDRSFHNLSLFILPYATGLVCLSHELIYLVFGSEHLKSVAPMKLLALSIVPFFFNQVMGISLTACTKEFLQMKILIFCSVIHLTLSIIFIPIYGYYGICISYLASQWTSFFFLMYFMIKEIDSSTISNLKLKTLKVLSASFVIAVTITQIHLNVFIEIAISIVLYTILIGCLLGFENKRFNFNSAYGEWGRFLKKIIIPLINSKNIL